MEVADDGYFFVDANGANADRDGLRSIVKRGDGPKVGGGHRRCSTTCGFNLDAAWNGDLVVKGVEGSDGDLKAGKLLEAIGREVDLQAGHGVLG